MDNLSVDVKEIFVRIIKYVIEGTVIAIALVLVPSKSKLTVQEVLVIALIAAAVFSLLDTFSPSVGNSTRMGVGFGVGAGLMGAPAFAR